MLLRVRPLELHTVGIVILDMARKKREFHLPVHVPLFPVAYVLGKFAVADLIDHNHTVRRQIGNFDVERRDVLQSSRGRSAGDGHNLAHVKREFHLRGGQATAAAYRMSTSATVILLILLVTIIDPGNADKLHAVNAHLDIPPRTRLPVDEWNSVIGCV